MYFSLSVEIQLLTGVDKLIYLLKAFFSHAEIVLKLYVCYVILNLPRKIFNSIIE